MKTVKVRGHTRKNLRSYKNLVYDVLDRSEGAEDFWFGLYRSKEKAEQVAKKLNQLFKGTGVRARVEFARNYNPFSIPWGVFIYGLTEKRGEALLNKWG